MLCDLLLAGRAIAGIDVRLTLQVHQVRLAKLICNKNNISSINLFIIAYYQNASWGIVLL